MNLAEQIIAYMDFRGDVVHREDGRVNIVYLEGANPDGTENADRPDEWNDMEYVIRFQGGVPEIIHSAICTTEPGVAPTHTAAARKRGGIGRIILGQQLAWKAGFHHSDENHPALVQAPGCRVLVHRDVNEDYKRSGDPIKAASGVNQHSTRPDIVPKRVGMWSEACLVRPVFDEHLKFLWAVISDSLQMAKIRAVSGNNIHLIFDPNQDFSKALFAIQQFVKWAAKTDMLFHTAVYGADSFQKFVKSL